MEDERQTDNRNKVKADIRTLEDMKEVVYDTNWLKEAGDMDLYYMYRGIDEKDNLRYDITVIPPRLLGKEFVKTKGHYHQGSFGELYIVLEGRAIYLLQKMEGRKIGDVYYVKAKAGDHVIIPAHYGHVTINPSHQALKMANWVSKDCVSDYKDMSGKGGACYYFTLSGWIKNKNYQKVPKLRSKKPAKKFPKNLDFLYGKRNK